MLKYLLTKQELFLHVLPVFTPVMFKQLTTCPFANYRTAHSSFPATTARAEGSVTNRPNTRGQQWWQHNRAGASVPLSCGGRRTFRSRHNHHTTCTYSHSLALSIHPTLPRVAPRTTTFISQLRGATAIHIDGTFTHVCSL